MNSVTTSLPIVISCSICPGYRAVVGWLPDGLPRRTARRDAHLPSRPVHERQPL
jgi:hypothetical protein